MTKFLNKHQFIKYMIVGVLCTGLNIVLYCIFFSLIKERVVANVIAYIITLLISFILNKKYVFNNTNNELIFVQFLIYTSVRLTSLLIDSGVLLICVEKLHLSDLLGKIISNACTTVNNYIFNKFIFKR